MERFKPGSAGSASALSGTGTAATAAASGHGTAKPLKEIHTCKREQNDNYSSLHDIFLLRKIFRYSLGKTRSMPSGLFRRHPLSLDGEGCCREQTLSKTKIIFKFIFAFAVSNEYGGTIKIKRTGKDGLDLNKRGTPTLRNGTKQTGSSGTIYALPALTH